MPTFLHTNWDCGVPNVRYRKDELQLQQPKGFPIIVMPSTLARARKEAEARAKVVSYTGHCFEIYEDEDEGENGVGGEDDYEAGDEEDGEYECEDQNDYYEKDDHHVQASAPTFISEVASRKPLAVVDSLGRTRAAANRLKAQVSESDQLAGPPGTSIICGEDKAAGNRKRKRGATQASKKPRKINARKVMLCMRSREAEL